ncbi:hypothetical protein RB601_003651 [Gaeumannomyces tritici]
MADTDLIARVYPYAEEDLGEVPEATLNAFKTSPGCVIPREQPSKRQSASRRERQSTEPLEAQNVPVLDTLPYVELRLSDTPRFRSGFIFGWGPNSDVVLPNNRGVGYHHFSLTFDDNKRPIVKDWGFLNGTQVTYGKQGHGVRPRFQWIVGGHRILLRMQPIIVSPRASPPVQLQIIVFPHDIASPAYIERVDRFFQNAPATEDLLSSLNIASRPVTERPTGTHTPNTGPIHLRKRLGKGSFAVVIHYWNVSTGEEYALKKPSEKAHRWGRVRINAWRNEAHIMNLISHPHVVKLLKSDFTEGPRLHLEYVPGGSLANQRNISAVECVSILQQCLSALEYLHGSDPPIVHRDIKADNILVQYRDTSSIYVKFGDFGLAKDYNNMSTICGNFAHLAPEVYQNHQYIEAGGKGRVSYTEAVDVWSLGVVVYGFLCPFPQFENQYISNGTAWAEKLIKMFKKDFEERPDELRRFLLDAMVVLLPEQRWSAGDCLAEAALLSAPAWNQSETAVAVSYVGDDERSTIRYKAEPGMAQGLERQPGSSEYSTLSTDAGRYDRSGAPTPRASVPASASRRKRATAPTSSSSGRHRKRREHGSSSSRADTASRQQRDRVLHNHTRASLPPDTLEDNDQDQDDWDLEEDDSGHHQEGIDAAILLHTLRQPGITTAFEPMARINGEAAAPPVASSYYKQGARIHAPPGQDNRGGWYLGQGNSAGVDYSCGEDPTEPTNQIDSQQSGLFSSGDPLNPLLVGSSVAAWGGVGGESSARAAPSHASVVEEDDDLPPPWSLERVEGHVIRHLAAADALKHEFFTADLYDHHDPAATQLHIGGGNDATAARPTSPSAHRGSSHFARSSRQRAWRPASAARRDPQDIQPWGLEATAPWQNGGPSATVGQIATSAWLRQSGDPFNPEVGAAPAAIPGSHELVSNPEAVPEEDTAAPRPSSYNAGGQTAGSLGTDPCQITPQFASPPPFQTYWLAQHGTPSADARAEKDGGAVAEDEAVVFRPSSYSADGQAVGSLAADTCPSGLSWARGIALPTFGAGNDISGYGPNEMMGYGETPGDPVVPTPRAVPYSRQLNASQIYPIDGGFDGGFVDLVNAPNGDGNGDDNQYPGQATPMASHLSTRSVTEADGQAYVVIKRQRVSIRTSDYYFNASEILAAAGESRSSRDRILYQIRGIAKKDRSRVWVPFSIGVQLCRRLGLDADIQGLLKFGPPAFPKKGGNYQEGEEGDGGEGEMSENTVSSHP